MTTSIWIDLRFEAAHWLPGVPPHHKCARLHGHSYRVRVYLSGDVDEVTGMVIDFDDVRGRVMPVVSERLDHRCLNDVPGLENPTSENLARWLWVELADELPQLDAIEVAETPESAAIYRAG